MSRTRYYFLQSLRQSNCKQSDCQLPLHKGAKDVGEPSRVRPKIIRPLYLFQCFGFSGISKRREISLPPGGRWILRSKRRKEPARVLSSSHQQLQNKATRTLLQSPTAPALVATRSLLGSDSPLDCHSIPRSRFATSRREPSRVRPKIIRRDEHCSSALIKDNNEIPVCLQGKGLHKSRLPCVKGAGNRIACNSIV